MEPTKQGQIVSYKCFKCGTYQSSIAFNTISNLTQIKNAN